MGTENTVVLVEGARTAVGRYAGGFRSTPTSELGAAAIAEALRRAGVPASEVDEVVLGCVGQVGPEIFNARRAALEAGIPAASTAYNVNRLCGSGLQAIWAGVNSIRLGQAKVVVAGGNENMSLQPFLDYQARDGSLLGDRKLVDGTLSLVTDPWGNYAMGVTAENVARKFNISRSDQDAFAVLSQSKAAKAQAEGIFAEEIVGVTTRDRKQEVVIDKDEHLRPGTSLETLARLRPAFASEGSVTAGNSSGINDAAAAVILMTEREAQERGLTALARLVGFAVTGIEPAIMGYAPVGAIRKVLANTGCDLSEVDVVELNEAFAAQAVAVIRDAQLDPDLVNPYGGAIALGHPVGATGAILALRLAYTLRRTAAHLGLVTMCIGGGQAIAALLERVE
ncbi:acetyl-CoA C-acetyltransferase [Microbacterium kribbense]|uniref:Probable acetyl-CoA acetyltransferase n=1 Tax=Microbacterium kribbense TaxID=433645 RepID=A0ABP7GVE5_9MICO